MFIVQNSFLAFHAMLGHESLYTLLVKCHISIVISGAAIGTASHHNCKMLVSECWTYHQQSNVLGWLPKRGMILKLSLLLSSTQWLNTATISHYNTQVCLTSFVHEWKVSTDLVALSVAISLPMIFMLLMWPTTHIDVVSLFVDQALLDSVDKSLAASLLWHHSLSSDLYFKGVASSSKRGTTFFIFLSLASSGAAQGFSLWPTINKEWDPWRKRMGIIWWSHC